LGVVRTSGAAEASGAACEKTYPTIERKRTRRAGG
jgi:hypothetical protein